ncbi:MAG: CDP-diacylglycerol--serine O-phosphatidyltransferase [Candidatus Theseobacter exili]|nr:CDP-diacylglycerol--serine O-phosphatidyltransferase [Candidatus Theseobacter exili]
MKKIYLLPNLVTTANFFCGVLSMILTVKGAYPFAAWLIILAMIFDFMDGYLARLSNSTSRFGVEFDSMADLTTFGLAPTLLVYRFFLSDLGRLGIGVAFLFSVSTALRLARFNVQRHGEEKDSFTGLPSPAAAGVLVSTILVMHRYSLTSWAILPLGMILLSYLMISTVKFSVLGAFGIHKRKPFVYLAAAVLFFVAIIFYSEICIFIGFIGYLGINLYNALFQKKKSDQSEINEIESDEDNNEILPYLADDDES